MSKIWGFNSGTQPKNGCFAEGGLYFSKGNLSGWFQIFPFHFSPSNYDSNKKEKDYNVKKFNWVKETCYNSKRSHSQCQPNFSVGPSKFREPHPTLHGNGKTHSPNVSLRTSKELVTFTIIKLRCRSIQGKICLGLLSGTWRTVLSTSCTEAIGDHRKHHAL